MLTPETIASRRFDKQMGGYKQDEVEIFLQQVPPGTRPLEGTVQEGAEYEPAYDMFTKNTGLC